MDVPNALDIGNLIRQNGELLGSYSLSHEVTPDLSERTIEIGIPTSIVNPNDEKMEQIRKLFGASEIDYTPQPSVSSGSTSRATWNLTFMLGNAVSVDLDTSKPGYEDRLKGTIATTD